MSCRERRLLLFVLAAAVAVRVWVITLHIYAPDQSFQVELGRDTWRGLIHDTGGDTHPPFYYCLVKIWFMFTPATLAWAQAFTVLLSIPTLLLIFRLGRDQFSPAAGGSGCSSPRSCPTRSSGRTSRATTSSWRSRFRCWSGRLTAGRASRRAALVGDGRRDGALIQTNYFAFVLIPVWLAASARRGVVWQRREPGRGARPGAQLFCGGCRS